MLQVNQIFSWSQWYPLEDCLRNSPLPETWGLYRIRRCGRDDLDYIGQTSGRTMSLRTRVAMLKGVLGEEIPYRDPHTAGPALWALRHKFNCSFEVSVLPVEGTTPWRKGLEALAISLHRQEFGRSPTVSFGRMPDGYRMSSGNTSKLVNKGKRFRGGVTEQQDLNHLPSLAPTGSLTGNPLALDWCGHEWSDWMPISQTLKSVSSKSVGLYRIRGVEQSTLVYIGQGVIRSRIGKHLEKAMTPLTKQGVIFADAQPLEASYVCNSVWHEHQRLELENDLIASHLLVTEEIPDAQFLG